MLIRIILTATISPQSNFRLALTDPSERSKQYGKALQKWCQWATENGARIVFVENSGTDLNRFALESLGRIPDCLDLVEAPVPPDDMVARGKGASEALMLDLVAQQFADDPGETLWLKSTGRLYVNNLMEILPTASAADNLMARMSLDLNHADARLFGGSAQSWRNVFIGMGDEVLEADEQRLEHVLARRVCLGIGQGAELLRFRGQPAIEGVSGTWHGRDYGGLNSRAKRAVAQLLDFVLRERLPNKHY